MTQNCVHAKPDIDELEAAKLSLRRRLDLGQSVPSSVDPELNQDSRSKRPKYLATRARNQRRKVLKRARWLEENGQIQKLGGTRAKPAGGSEVTEDEVAREESQASETLIEGSTSLIHNPSTSMELEMLPLLPDVELRESIANPIRKESEITNHHEKAVKRGTRIEEGAGDTLAVVNEMHTAILLDGAAESTPAKGLSMADFDFNDMEAVSADEEEEEQEYIVEYENEDEDEEEELQQDGYHNIDANEYGLEEGQHINVTPSQEAGLDDQTPPQLCSGGSEVLHATQYQLLREMKEHPSASDAEAEDQSLAQGSFQSEHEVWETPPTLRWSKVTDGATLSTPATSTKTDPSQNISAPPHGLDPPSNNPPQPSQNTLYHYPTLANVPAPLRRYYRNRLSLFTLYHTAPGINLTPTCWYSVTPEAIALKIATHLFAGRRPGFSPLVIDAFAGAGGNSIAFARHPLCRKVIAIEKDPEVLACAMHNAAVYGVSGKICWMLGDAFEILDVRKNEKLIESWRAEAGKGGLVAFGSPPWGGPEYKRDDIFDVEAMKPYGLASIMEMASGVTSDVCLYLPRTSDLQQVQSYLEEEIETLGGERMTGVVDYRLNGFSKAICVWFGRSMSPLFRWSAKTLDQTEFDEIELPEDMVERWNAEDPDELDGDVATSQWKSLQPESKNKKRRRASSPQYTVEASFAAKQQQKNFYRDTPRRVASWRSNTIDSKRQKIDGIDELNYDD